MKAFYDRFDRHDGGAGLKARTTHYCAGCGHGLAHRYLSDAIEALGIQDRTVAVSPVGCAVFLYYYLDVGNTQAAHGRASAVALGHKLANPGSVVVSYQGDGDLASIGLTEILQVAQLGAPLTIAFVNNAIYGMTGGQLAPTTLLGQKTTTSPRGRDRTMGQPLRMAELVASLDGPVYVERVALFDAKQRVRAARAIEKALRYQVEDRGFTFVEVLAECPTHLRMSPLDAERWVRDEMLPVFPLGVKKDLPDARWGEWPAPRFDPGPILEALEAQPPADDPPATATRASGGLGVKLAGAGGDGAQTAAALVARAAIAEGFDATHIPCYGPESRGGTSFADVRLAADEVLAPEVPCPDALVAFNAPSLARFAPALAPGGVVVYDSAVIRAPALAPGVRAAAVPCARIAAELGSPLVKNAVALGALHVAAGLLSEATFVRTIREALARSAALADVNVEAFLRGVRAAQETYTPPHP
ncbi:MAG TPA: 2-oxoacid:acceptor oxidoreductase family protein [Anaeromyxobacter sp.]|nr:2-oxoacid:acceptor oxidoreductase family protein [Anaeromyxobacter sp.]